MKTKRVHSGEVIKDPNEGKAMMQSVKPDQINSLKLNVPHPVDPNNHVNVLTFFPDGNVECYGKKIKIKDEEFIKALKLFVMAFNNNHPRPPISNKLNIVVDDDSEILTIDGVSFSYDLLRDFDVDVAEKVLADFKKNTDLCSYCVKEFAECDGKPKFGTGLGNDNVYACPQYESEK